MSENDNKNNKELEEKLQKEQLELNEKALEEKVKQMSEKLTPLEFYKACFEEGWDQGFSCGMDCEVDELHEAAEGLSDLHLHALHDMFEEVEKKYNEETSVSDSKLSD